MGAWRTVFLCAAGVYIADSVIFIIFGSSQSQPWNEPTLSKEPKLSKEAKITKKDVAKSDFQIEPTYRKTGTLSLPTYLEQGMFYKEEIKRAKETPKY